MAYQKIDIPSAGEPIVVDAAGQLQVPNQPIIPFIEGDGVGPDIFSASRAVFDAAVEQAYGGERKVAWMEVYAGEKAQEVYGELLPQDTLDAIKEFKVAIKGPLTTPVGKGFRSLNVSLRQMFDLYACIRPIRYFPGVPAPIKHPEKIDMTVFRENTEDVYAGIEWESGSADCNKVEAFLSKEMGAKIRKGSGIGIKPISAMGSKRLARMAISYAIENHKPSVTFVHKGNIQKFTEGAFCSWAFDVAKEEFADKVVFENDLKGGTVPSGKVLIKDRIADAMFQQALLRPSEYSVIATTNLNGDYLSDALVAQVGGLGLGPGANVGEQIALFEATHGSAPKYTGMDKVNPGSVILSGSMMFRHLGWNKVSDLIEKGIERAISAKRVTYDLERQMDGATLLKCSEFGREIVKQFGDL